MRVYLAMFKWEHVIESAQKLLGVKTQYPEAIILLTLHSITQNGHCSDAVNRLGELIQAIDRFEPQNAALYFKCGKLFSTVASRNIQILNQTLTLIERAMSLEPDNVLYTIENARNLFLMGKYKESYEAYNKCNKMDDYSVPAMVGSLMCHCVAIDKRMRDNKKISDVGDQLEFLTAIKESSKI